ncbi:glycosyltransferase family 2 protein [Arthrobacter sp. B6]|uniref:glycosyltransferase family 2 protein n=1 Tax=Arthrobacter sp. B6 TaxID=1570137 RepID=UPI0008338B98|nr:glycosyltransferase family 2 protein [Arthrobacter sp. B6]
MIAVPDMIDSALMTLGPFLFMAVSVIGVRMAGYWLSFIFFSGRFRRREAVTTTELRGLDVPFVKIQITTRGSDGSTGVILRGIRNVVELGREDPAFYSCFLSVEVVTESADQAETVRSVFQDAPIAVHTLVIPVNYETPAGTGLKARGLHYAVENRRGLWNRKPGRTFIVHYDEESVMVPDELRKLVKVLSTTKKKVLEGPIYYPLEYLRASVLCRSMEANRPMGCYECRHVMESGVPLHLHGSNLVVDEALENELGWDIGSLDGRPFIAEDYVFGMNAFTKYGRGIFDWHGCLMLEQPPFSVHSAFKQRYRWIFGVLQGITAAARSPRFRALPLWTRTGLLWGTRFRIATFALGAVVGTLSLLVVPIFVGRALAALILDEPPLIPGAASLWLAVIGSMWLGSVFVGAWHNVADAGLDRWSRTSEIARAVAVAPISGICESSAALVAVAGWMSGKRGVEWIPTPKTKQADLASIRNGD